MLLATTTQCKPGQITRLPISGQPSCSEVAVGQKWHPKWNPGRWTHGLTAAVLGGLILTHTQVSFNIKPHTVATPQFAGPTAPAPLPPTAPAEHNPWTLSPNGKLLSGNKCSFAKQQAFLRGNKTRLHLAKKVARLQKKAMPFAFYAVKQCSQHGTNSCYPRSKPGNCLLNHCNGCFRKHGDFLRQRKHVFMGPRRDPKSMDPTYTKDCTKGTHEDDPRASWTSSARTRAATSNGSILGTQKRGRRPDTKRGIFKASPPLFTRPRKTFT